MRSFPDGGRVKSPIGGLLSIGVPCVLVFVLGGEPSRVTPAMPAGVTDHVWVIGETVNLLG